MALTPINYSAGQDNMQEVFDKINAIITAVNELQGGTVDQIFKKTDGTDFAFEATNSVLPDSGTANLKVKVIEIGDWNMVSVGIVNVTHGISNPTTTIRDVRVFVRNDANDTLYPLDRTAGDVVQGGVTQIGSTTVAIYRDTAGFFDDANFNSTGYNRGWVTIIYEG